MLLNNYSCTVQDLVYTHSQRAIMSTTDMYIFTRTKFCITGYLLPASISSEGIYAICKKYDEQYYTVFGKKIW